MMMPFPEHDDEMPPLNSRDRNEAAEMLGIAASNPWRLITIGILGAMRMCDRVDQEIPLAWPVHMLRASVRGLITAGALIGATVGAILPVLVATYLLIGIPSMLAFYLITAH